MGSAPSQSASDVYRKDSSSQRQNSGLQGRNGSNNIRLKQTERMSTAAAFITAKQLVNAKKKQLEDAKRKVLDEYPELADSLESVKMFMKQMEPNVEMDVKNKTMSLSSKKYAEEILDLFYEHEPMGHRKLLGDEIAANKGGEVFAEYLKTLSAKNSTESPINTPYQQECQAVLKSVCWNFSDASEEFCVELGKAGTFHVLVDDMSDCSNKLNDNRIRFNIVMPSISILHNCAKVSSNKIHMKDAKVLEAVVPYLTAVVPEIRMIAMMTVAYIIDDKDNEIISTDNSMIKYILRYLKDAIASADHKFDGFSAEEIVSGLMHLASNDKNKETIVNEGVLPMLVELLKNGSESEKTIVAKTIWVLSFSSANKKKILNDEDLMKTLESLSKTQGSWRESSAGAIWVLEEEKRLHKIQQRTPASKEISTQRKFKRKQMISPSVDMLITMEKTASPSSLIQRKSEMETDDEKVDSEGLSSEEDDSKRENECGIESADGKHLMISYQWQNQKLIMRLKDKLVNAGYKIWIDVESMGGSTLEAMADAVENSTAVLICMSKKYKDSPNTRTEAEYAYKLGKKIIPLRVERSYDPDGWLGALLGAKLYFDFSNIAEFEAAFSKLSKELGDRGKALMDETDGPRNLPSSLTLHASPQFTKSVKNWTISDVKNWASDNNISIKKSSTLNGEALLFLKRLSYRAPEFFYKYAYDRLGLTELQDLMKLDTALEALSD